MQLLVANSRWKGVFALLLTLITVQPLFAHALSGECKIRGDRIELAAYYDDRTAARKAKVRITAAGQTIAEGVTDSKGLWSFPLPPAGDYQALIDAGLGHRATLKLRIPPQTADKQVISSAVEAEHREHDPIVSEGPSKAEFTRIPWGNILLGLGVIAGGAIVGILLLRWRRSAGQSSTRVS